jgi:hypothetical protein
VVGSLAAKRLESGQPVGRGPEYVGERARAGAWGTLEGARIWSEGKPIYGHVFTEEEIRAQAKLSRHTASFEEYPPLGA